MNKLAVNRYSIFVLLLLMTIGFAAINTTLSLNGRTDITNAFEEYDVYYSDVFVNGQRDLGPVEEAKALTFIPYLIDGNYVVEYDISNSSANYDANISVTCTTANPNIKITNEFDTSTPVDARTIRRGKITVHDFSEGQEVTLLGSEKFNVISSDENTVTMFTKYNIGTNYMQSSTANAVSFSSSSGWTYTPGPQEIDIQTYGGNSKTYLNNYIANLQTETGDSSITGDLITLAELKELGCTIPETYGYASGVTCVGSRNESWIVNNQLYRTRSASSASANNIWNVAADGSLTQTNYRYTSGIRPKVTVSKYLLNNAPVTCRITSTPVENTEKGENDKLNSVTKYNIGRQVTIGSEKFNIIQVKDDEVVLLAANGLNTSYRQAKNKSDEAQMYFADTNGWEYAPGPKEIDLSVWSPYTYPYITNYQTYIRGLVGSDEVIADLPTMAHFKSAGCTLKDDYTYAGNESCNNSVYSEWLVTGTGYWTKSAGDTNIRVWTLYPNGALYDMWPQNNMAVRPVIIMPFDVFENYVLSKMTSEYICKNLGYKYGKDYEEAASNLPENEIPIICSDKSDYSTSCMYLKDGTKVSCN